MLVDAGPLVAICDETEPNHRLFREIIQPRPVAALCSWAVLTEAMYLLGRHGSYHLQSRLWNLIDENLVRLHAHTDAELIRMRALMEKYQNVPMDLADASLVAAAETLDDRVIFTLDSDFRIYRLADGSAFSVVPE